MSLRRLLGRTVNQVLARADGWLAPLRDAERAAHMRGRGPCPADRLREASVAANVWMLCTPEGTPVYALRALRRAVHQLVHPPSAHAAARARPRPTPRAHAHSSLQSVGRASSRRGGCRN